MPLISYIDNCNRLDNLIYNNDNIQYICGNPLLISILISLIVIIIVNLNYKNCFSQFLYYLLFIIPLILLENKIIKYHYVVKGRGDNNIFNNSSDVIGSGTDNIIEPRQFIKEKKVNKDENNIIGNDESFFKDLLNV